MDDSNFTTIFDIAHSGYRQWGVPAFGLIVLIVVFIRPVLAQKELFTYKLLYNKRFRFRVRAFWLFWTACAFGGTYWDYIHGKNVLISGDAGYTEGRVENFVVVPFKSESFTVGNVPFCYSDGGSAGYNHMGGPIRPGLFVRIWYLRGNSAWTNEILKLEIQKAGD